MLPIRLMGSLRASAWILPAILLTACGGGGNDSQSTGTGTTTTSTPTTGGSTASGSTANVLCPFAESGTLAIATRGSGATSTLPYSFSWTCAAGSRSLVSNSVPNHAVSGGNFATAISAQSITASFTLTPALASATGTGTILSGYSINGMKLEPGTAGVCNNAGICDPTGGSGTWRMEALGGSFSFGTDANNSHTQPSGEYHIHGIPENLLTKLAKGQAMTLIGWAPDGFPIYARYGYLTAADAASGVKVLKGSYRLKASADSGRPSTAVYVMGSFRQDWEYVPGYGDLDECNGRIGVTPEFPAGTYHYVMTDTYPFIHRCLKGAGVPQGPPPF